MMKKVVYSLLIPVAIMSMVAFKPMAGRLLTKSAHVNFFSHTPLEDITANNYKVVSTLDPATGVVVFSVPMQSFEFEKALMQEHFNGKDFLNTKEFPKAKFDGKITNIHEIAFENDGEYKAVVEGTLTIKDVAQRIREKGIITVTNGKVNAKTKFTLVLSDYGITFKKGKPSTNIAKQIEVSLNADYDSE